MSLTTGESLGKTWAKLNVVMQTYPNCRMGAIMAAVAEMMQPQETADDVLDNLAHVDNDTLNKYLDKMIKGEDLPSWFPAGASNPNNY